MGTRLIGQTYKKHTRYHTKQLLHIQAMKQIICVLLNKLASIRENLSFKTLAVQKFECLRIDVLPKKYQEKPWNWHPCVEQVRI